MSEILEAIRRREEVATKGPWTEDPDSYIVSRGDDMICADLLTHADAEFIAHARTDIPLLLAALDAVLAPHQRQPATYGDDDAICMDCGEWWPCHTIQAVNDALEVEQDA